MAPADLSRSGTETRILPAFLFLLLVPAPLAEILSENIPLLKFLNPVVAALLILSYGLPLLLIRELAAARRIGVTGLFLLGLAYGIYNEGILARTLTLPEGQPVGVFAGFGKTGPLQTGWALMILPWHALHSVIYPILISRWMFPAAAPLRWMQGWRLKLAVAVWVATYLMYFRHPELHKDEGNVDFDLPPDVGTFALFLLATAGLIFGALGFRLPEDSRTLAAPASRRPFPSARPCCCFTCFNSSPRDRWHFPFMPWRPLDFMP